ncbi:hypothetical protein CLV24_1575 [Pontibacter ummariensis]|uniref:Uncharacterized protein n=1 Tax=Pontibacter ummariensis TaxID=1610492 RepID=A0A239LXS0_9BACT|nr:hypothetical protein [Pontibacter ummariensis]PRY00208.1 hypothetical protein CLV24_1575 [Pontibacter ummariensis]SNT35070.1 hypothetical protein SAMN06296052_1575 [Pontibacter ummariensis]
MSIVHYVLRGHLKLLGFSTGVEYGGHKHCFLPLIDPINDKVRECFHGGNMELIAVPARILVRLRPDQSQIMIHHVEKPITKSRLLRLVPGVGIPDFQLRPF